MTKTKKNKAFYSSEIPSDWSQGRIADVTRIYDGTHTTPNYVSSGVPFYSVEHVTSNNFNNTKYISEEVFTKESERVVLEKGDILMTRIGDIGTTRFIDWDVRASFYVSLALIKTKDKNVDTKFISQFINSNYFQRELYQRTIHVAFPKKINLGEIGECLVAIPPLPEQKAIAHILGLMDNLINKNDQLIAQKELRKKWLMQNLLTGKKRLQGFKNTNDFQKTDLGMKIPKDWAIVKVKYLFAERKETSNNQLNYPLFSLTIEKGLTEKTDRYERSFLLKNKETNLYKLVYPNDILFNPMNLRFGAIAKSKINKVVSVSAYYNSIYINKGNTNIDYYEALFKTQTFFNLYDRIAIGSLNEKKRVHLSNFIELEIPFPSIEEQTAIAQVLQAADKEIELLKTKATKLREQKKGMMQVLLTGKKRLKLNTI